MEQRLNVAAEYFGEDRLLRSITTMHLEEYIDFLMERARWEGTDRASDATWLRKVLALETVSQQRNGFAPNLANRVTLEVEVTVIESACRTPELGPRKVAAALAEDGVEVSASGVRWILKRYELHPVRIPGARHPGGAD